MKKLIAIVLMLTMLLGVTAGCAGLNDPTETENNGQETTQEQTGDTATGGDLKFAVVLHALNSSFYAKIQEGAEEAGKALGVQVDVMAPNTANNLAEQISMIETCISSDYDGIATVVWDPDGFTDVIAKAKAEGIPFISLNQNSGKDDGTVFIGQDLEVSGYMLGKYMFEEVMNGEGSYIIASCAPADVALIARENGIRRAQEEYPGIEFIELVDITTDLTTAVGVIENAYIANPDVDAFLGVDVFSESIGTFIDSNDLQGELYGAGFDLTEGTLQHVANDAMQLTIGQNPFLQGYYPVVQLFTYMEHGYEPMDMNTGAFLVTEDNVASVDPE